MKKNIEIVMLGDSITGRGNWKVLLENEKVLNFGIDGDTTKGILSRVNQIIELEPKTVFIMAGVNDLCLSIPLETIFENYKNILVKFRNKNINTIVQTTLITQMPAVNKKIKVFNGMLKDYCQENSIRFFDFNYAFSNDEGLLREDLTTDGLHLGQKAYKVWAYKLKNSISQTN